MAVWNILSLIFQKFDQEIARLVFGSGPTIAILVLAFCWIGYTVIDEKDGCCGAAAKSGAWLGALFGFVAAILGIIALYVMPEFYDEAIKQSVSQDAPEDLMRQLIEIGTYINLVLLPLIYGLLGAVISSLVALITKKFAKK